MDPSENAVDAAARLIIHADHLVALVGAGLSVESGIPPFRGQLYRCCFASRVRVPTISRIKANVATLGQTH